MGFYEKFSDEINEKTDFRKSKRAEYKKEIEKQESLARQYQAAIDSDMEKGPASTETAQNSLNMQYAQKRRDVAETDLIELEKEPLYSLEAYNDACRKIINTYKADVMGERAALRDKIAECLDLIDKMENAGREAVKCDSLLRGACRECGQDINATFAKAQYKGLSGYVTPYRVKDWKRDLEGIGRDLK